MLRKTRMKWQTVMIGLLFFVTTTFSMVQFPSLVNKVQSAVGLWEHSKLFGQLWMQVFWFQTPIALLMDVNMVSNQVLWRDFQSFALGLPVTVAYFMLFVKHYTFDWLDTAPNVMILFLNWCLYVLLMDAVFYFTHLLMHKVPILWTYHKQHHQHGGMICAFKTWDADPVELLVNGLWPIALPPLMVHIYPILIPIMFAFFQLNALLSHSHYFIKHKQHHQQLNKNFSICTYVWDALFGTS